MALPVRMSEPRRCVTNHRNVTEDGVRVVREAGKRWAYVLGTCRDCNRRVWVRWEMRKPHQDGWSDDVDQMQSLT